METRLVVEGAEPASLHEWLRRADELRGRVRPVSRVPAAGEIRPDGTRVEIAAEHLRSVDELTELLEKSLHTTQDD